MLTYILMLNLDTSQHLALHDLNNITDNPDSIFTSINKDRNELFITFLKEHTTESFGI